VLIIAAIPYVGLSCTGTNVATHRISESKG